MPGRQIIITAYSTMGMLGVYMTVFQYTILDMTRLFLPNNIAMIGVLIGAQSLGMGVSPLVFGWVSEKIGKKKVVLIAYSLFVIGTLAIGLTPWLAVFIIAAFITGSGTSVLEATITAVLADEFPESSIRHINFSQVFFGIGAMIGPAIAKGLIAGGVFFKDLFSFCSFVFVLLGVAFFFTKHRNDVVKKKSGNAEPGIVVLLKNRIFLLLAVYILIYIGIELSVANFSGSYFELALGNKGLSAAALSLFWGAMIPSRFIAGLQKIDTRTIMFSSMAIAFVGVICAMLLPWHPVKLVMFAMCGFGCGPLWPMTMNEAAKKVPGSSGLIMNTMFVFCAIGGTLFPFFYGILAGETGQARVFYMCGAAAIALIALYIRFVRESGKGPGQSPRQP